MVHWTVGLLTLVALLGCVQPRGDEFKSSELTPHFTRTVSGVSVICDAYFTLESDPSTPVTLEDDALMTCNSVTMTRSGPYFTAGVTYTPGGYVAISLIRRVDGSALTDTQIVY